VRGGRLVWVGAEVVTNHATQVILAAKDEGENDSRNGAKGGTRTPTGFHPSDPKSDRENAESLGNVRKHIDLARFSATSNAETLGRLGNAVGDIWETVSGTL